MIRTTLETAAAFFVALCAVTVIVGVVGICAWDMCEKHYGVGRYKVVQGAR